jgi:hypothetical protein
MGVIMNFLMVNAVLVDKPDRRMLVNMASVQCVRPRAVDDRPEIGSWLLWNTLDEPTALRDEFEVIVSAIDNSHGLLSRFSQA